MSTLRSHISPEQLRRRQAPQVYKVPVFVFARREGDFTHNILSKTNCAK
jgi:hypothetical protein